MSLARRFATSARAAAAFLPELARLERSLARSRDEVAHDQLQAARAIAGRAARRVPLYRDRLPGDVEERLTALGALQCLPLVDRAQLAAAELAERRAGDGADIRRFRTSGTTGHPLFVEEPRWVKRWSAVLQARTDRHRGLQPWHRRAVLVSRQRVDSHPSRVSRLAGRRSLVLSPALPATDIASALRRRRPAMLGGYGHLLVEVGHHLHHELLPRVVATGGQQLTSEISAELRDLYGVAPLDSYGAIEVGTVAWQCREADLYHVNHELVLVEVVDEAGRRLPDGQLGDLAFTSLVNDHMPLIRYRIGDVGALATRACRCGSQLPALERIDGRVMDWFVGADGRRVTPHRLFFSVCTGLETVGLIRRYRVVQDSAGAVTVSVVPATRMDHTVLRQVRDSYRTHLGFPVTVELVEELVDEPSGKFRQFVSHASAPEPAR